MPTLKSVRSGKSTKSFDFGDDEIEFSYKVGDYTADYLDKLGVGDGKLEPAEWLAGLVTSWNMYEDKEQTEMVPITDETMRSMPMPFLNRMVKEIIGDVNEGEEPASSFVG